MSGGASLVDPTHRAGHNPGPVTEHTQACGAGSERNGARPEVEVSVCIVTLNCWGVLKSCLESLSQGEPALLHEIVLVDNASTDGTPDLLRRHFPKVRVLENGTNVGFTRATNQAIELSSGRYILWLNPDTVLRRDSLYELWHFLESRPEAGIVGPKVLNDDGSFQPQCRRGLPTPSASLFYMLGLHRLRPKSPRFGAYLLSHLPVDQRARVSAVSGCCLMARRQVWEEIGRLDEDIFGFGEDIEWCVRAGKAGWEVWYNPASVIVHLKGQGGVHSRPFHKVWGIHQAMWLFYRKHLEPDYSWPTTGLVGLAVATSLVFSTLAVAFRRLVVLFPRPRQSPR
jgi:GT2 family glycosyltransferase